MNFRVLVSGAPVLVFYLLTRVSDPSVAVLGGFAATAIVFWFNRKDRLIGTLTAFGFVVVAISAVIGIVSDNEKAYLAAGPAGDFLSIGLYLGSIAIGKPLIGGIAREMFPAFTREVPVNAPVYVWLTLAWAAYDLLHGALRIWMLMELSVGEYLIVSRVAFWPLSAFMIGLSIWAVLRAARQNGATHLERSLWSILVGHIPWRRTPAEAPRERAPSQV